jgi:hypothetical protein
MMERVLGPLPKHMMARAEYVTFIIFDLLRYSRILCILAYAAS